MQTNSDYEQALNIANEYLKPSEGLVRTDMATVADKTIVRQNNVIILLLIQLHEKIDKVKERIELVKTESAIKELTEKLKDIKVDRKQKSVRVETTNKFLINNIQK